jgi:hypothetical protein
MRNSLSANQIYLRYLHTCTNKTQTREVYALWISADRSILPYMQTMLRLSFYQEKSLSKDRLSLRQSSSSLASPRLASPSLASPSLALPFHLGTKKERGRLTSMTEAMCISLRRLPALTLEFELLRYRSFFRLMIVLAAVEAAVCRSATVLTVSCFCGYGLLSRTIQIQ